MNAAFPAAKSSSRSRSSGPERSARRLAGAILLVCLVVTVLAGQVAGELVTRLAQARFNDDVKEAENWIRNRIDFHVHDLYGAGGLFAASRFVARDEWAMYLSRGGSARHHLGVEAIGFVERVVAEEKSAFLAAARAGTTVSQEGFPDFEIHPSGERPEYLAVKYVEPLESNRALLGRDFAVVPERLTAIRRAARSNRAAATGPLKLEGPFPEISFEIYVPVYPNAADASPALPPETPSGYVFGVFRTRELLSGVFSEKSESPAIDFEIFDGEILAGENLLYDHDEVLRSTDFSYRPRFMTHSILNVGERTWSLRFMSSPDFALPLGQDLAPLVVFAGGITGSFLVAGLLFSLLTARAAGGRLAELAAIVESTDDAVIGMDPQGNIATWNRAAERMYGFPSPEALGRPFSILIAPERRGEFQVILDRIRAEGRINYYESRRLRRDGAEIHVAETLSAIRGVSGELKGISAIDRDMTQLVKVRELLEQSKDFYLTLFEEFPAMIWQSGPDGERSYFNRTWLNFTGRTAENERGSGWISRLHPDGAAGYLEAYAQALRDRKPFMIECRLRRMDDQYRWLVDHGIPFNGLDGRFGGFIGCCIDITDRKRTESDLRQSLDLLFSIIENIPDMVFLKEAGDLRYELFNRTAEELMGVGRDELIGKNDYDLMPKNEADAAARRDYEILGAGRMLEISEERVRTRGKGERVFRTKRVPILADEKGDPLYLLGISEDITERKRAEEEIKKANADLVRNEKKLLKALAEVERAHADLKKTQSQLIRAEKFAEVGKLAGIISHEFRNQIAVIRNAAFFIRMRLKSQDAKVREHLAILEKEIEETDRIIENIIAFARKNKPELKSTDLEPLLQSCLEKVEPPQGVEVVKDIPARLPAIQADEVLLARVFVNVAKNAFEAMAGPGTLTVRVAHSPGEVEISFEDTGAGIAEEDKKRVFDPLFSTKSHGTGLGLATAKTLVEGHGGSIDIRSMEGKGTVVLIRLPAP